mmetsp:Transcript_57500/g.140997  ORF Transcript_57500/g.140997 Transcript_57500/m.140997 type:complete len:278 (-) Transcript_57500:995-1828(-)
MLLRPSLHSTPLGSKRARSTLNSPSGNLFLTLLLISSSQCPLAMTSILAQCSAQRYLSHSSVAHVFLYSWKRLVIAARCFVVAAVPSSVGRYMMIPSHEKSALGSGEPAGDKGAEDAQDQRCSRGAGAGMLLSSIIFKSSLVYSRSALDGLSIVPIGKATSETHCCPPHSNPRTSSLHSTRTPSLIFQHAASARFTRLMCSVLSGSYFNSSSRSWASDRVSTSYSGETPPIVSLSRARMGASRTSSGSAFLVGGTRYREGDHHGGSGLEATTTTVSV